MKNINHLFFRNLLSNKLIYLNTFLCTTLYVRGAQKGSNKIFPKIAKIHCFRWKEVLFKIQITIVLVFILSRYWFKSIIFGDKNVCDYEVKLILIKRKWGLPCDYKRFIPKKYSKYWYFTNIFTNFQKMWWKNAYFRGLASHMMVEHQI